MCVCAIAYAVEWDVSFGVIDVWCDVWCDVLLLFVCVCEGSS